jgi:hypothetical protein
VEDGNQLRVRDTIAFMYNNILLLYTQNKVGCLGHNIYTATLFGAGHIGTALEYKLSLPSHVRISRAWFEKSIGLVALGCWSRKISLRRPSPGSW